jgi:hypothetical protein
MRIPNIVDLQADEIAGRQFAVKRESHCSLHNYLRLNPRVKS